MYRLLYQGLDDSFPFCNHERRALRPKVWVSLPLASLYLPTYDLTPDVGQCLSSLSKS